MTGVHPQALVEDGAQIGDGVTVEAFAVVKSNVTLHDNVTIKSFSYIDGYTTIGEGTTVWPNVSIGTKTQHLQYSGDRTYVTIGKNCEIREFATINSSFLPETTVSVGDNCLLMAYSHVAHSCTVENNVILTNSAMLAGHVHVGEFAIIGGMTPIHQHVRIGKHAMIGGLSRVTYDVPPYTIGAGYPFEVASINNVGLKRRGFTQKQRYHMLDLFRRTYRSGESVRSSIEAIRKRDSEDSFPSLTNEWVEFFACSKRGVSQSTKKGASSMSHPYTEGSNS